MVGRAPAKIDDREKVGTLITSLLEVFWFWSSKAALTVREWCGIARVCVTESGCSLLASSGRCLGHMGPQPRDLLISQLGLSYPLLAPDLCPNSAWLRFMPKVVVCSVQAFFQFLLVPDIWG